MKTLTYTKPEVLAQNGKEGVFAAGCPLPNQNQFCIICQKGK